MTTAELIDRADTDEDRSFGPPAKQQPTGMVAVAESRAAQEVQAAMIVAKRFPRDQTAAFNKIIDACKRKSLAEQSQYAYPRGDKVVTGPSIRLAEVLAQNWGNLEFGIVEVEQRFGESVMCAFCWDLETNTKQSRVFTVKHKRHTKRGSYELSDPRDIYEVTANNGARRLRACILGVIPGDIIEAAEEQCNKTMAGKSGEPIKDRIRKMVDAFETLGISQARVEARIGHKVDTIIEPELANLRKMFLSVKDGMVAPEEMFPPPEGQQPAQGEQDPPKSPEDAVADKVAAARKKKAAADKPAEPQQAAETPQAEAAEPPAPTSETAQPAAEAAEQSSPDWAGSFRDEINNSDTAEQLADIDKRLVKSQGLKQISRASFDALRAHLKARKGQIG